MFVGREAELKALERLYNKGTFQMAVIYGRRRVGKTTLLDKFSEGKKTLFFTAQQKSDVLNLRAFSQAVYKLFGLPASAGAFETWLDALSFIAERMAHTDGPLLFVFDEFPYAAQASPSLPSSLQIAIDRDFKNANLCLVLCGSNEGFMESDVLGSKSPLYGRRNAQIRLQPFDYADAARMIPARTPQESVMYYAAFGGTPYYLSQLNAHETLEENAARLCFDIAGMLYAEPQMLLRQELREPSLYASVLDAIAAGATTPKVIAEKSGVDGRSIGKYLATLASLGIVEKIVPFGTSAASRKGIHRIRDPFFAYWYRFVSPNIGAIEAGAGQAVADAAFGSGFSTYVGTQFEKVCLQWLMRQNRQGRLPFLATSFGSWWGTDPAAREQVDIDVIAADKASGSIIAGECKWRSCFDESAAISTLERRARLIPGYETPLLMLFMKESPNAATLAKARERGDLRIVTAIDLYDGAH